MTSVGENEKGPNNKDKDMGLTVLITALRAQGADGLRVVSNNCGVDGQELGFLLTAGRIARVTGSCVGEDREFARRRQALFLAPEGNSRGGRWRTAGRIRPGRCRGSGP